MCSFLLDQFNIIAISLECFVVAIQLLLHLKIENFVFSIDSIFALLVFSFQGASQDIKQSTALARAMVTEYGFSDKIGPIDYGNDSDEVFIGRDLAHTRKYGENIAGEIDKEVKKIIDECYAKAKELILANKDVLDSCAAILIKKEKITREEFEALFETNN